MMVEILEAPRDGDRMAEEQVPKGEALQKEFCEMFPNVEPEWVEEKIREKWDMCKLLETMMDPEKREEVKMKPGRTVQRHKALTQEEDDDDDDEPWDYLGDLSEIPDFRYRLATEFYLSKDFRRISLMGLRAVTNFFRYHYGPTKVALDKALAHLTFADYDRISKEPKPYVYVSLRRSRTEKPRQFRLKILASRRWVPLNPRFTPCDSFLEEQRWLFNERQRKGKIATDEHIIASKRKLRDQEMHLQQQKREIEKRKALEEAKKVGTDQDCPICYEECAPCYMVSCLAGHKYCGDCLKKHAETSAYGESLFNCMQENCNANFPKSMLEEWISEPLREIFAERQQLDDLRKADLEDKLEKCGACNTPAIMEVPKEEDKVFKCPNPDCGIEWCRICKNHWNETHKGLPCSEMIKTTVDLMRKHFEETMAEALMRRCPACSRQILKSHGCNKIVCQCGKFFCYLCRRQIFETNPYDHFCKHGPDRDSACAACDKCGLFLDAAAVDQQTMQRIAREYKRDTGNIYELDKENEKEAKKRFFSSRNMKEAAFGPQPPPPPPPLHALLEDQDTLQAPDPL